MSDGIFDEVLFVMAAEIEAGVHLRHRFTPTIVGVGPIEAAIGTALALQARTASGRVTSLVVSLGSAGSRRHPVGTVCQVSHVSWRDMDATPLGFERGVTPFANHPACVELPTPLPGIPLATLSTGGHVVAGEGYDAVAADLVDMETFAVARAAARFRVPVIGIRGVSDGPVAIRAVEDWTDALPMLDERLANAVDLIPAASAVLTRGSWRSPDIERGASHG